MASEKPDQPIIDFEDKLAQPMLPDIDRAVDKIKKECPAVWTRFGGAVALCFAFMYAAIGFVGVLTFVLGMLTVIVLIGIAIFLYIVNENERARALREALEQER